VAEYIPLLTLVVTVAGGVNAFASISPVPAPARPEGLRMVLHERAHLNSYGYPWHTTPPGDPTIFGHRAVEPYNPPPVRLQARMHTIGTFTSPNRPVFRPQTPTSPTGEHQAVA